MFNVTDQCFMFPALRSFLYTNIISIRKPRLRFAKFLTMSRIKDMILFAEKTVNTIKLFLYKYCHISF